MEIHRKFFLVKSESYRPTLPVKVLHANDRFVIRRVEMRNSRVKNPDFPSSETHMEFFPRKV